MNQALVDLADLSGRQRRRLLELTQHTWPELGDYVRGSELDPDPSTRNACGHRIGHLFLILDPEAVGVAPDQVINPQQLKLRLVKST